MNKKLRKLFYRSLDGSLSIKEQEMLSNALDHSKELNVEKERILAMREAVSASAADSFKPFFAERVVNKIKLSSQKQGNPELFFDSMVYLFRRVALVGLFVTIALLSINLLQNDTKSMANEFISSEMKFEDVLVPAFTTSLEDVL